MTVLDSEKPRLWPRLLRRRGETAPEPPVIAPYIGFKRSPRREFWRRSVVPILVTFCLIYGLAWGIYGPFLPAPFAIAPAVLGMIAIWALPEMRTAPTKPVEVLLFVCMLVMILWPNYLAIAIPGLPWITMFRLFAAPLTIIFLTCISVSQSFRSDLLRVINAAPIIWKLLVAFVAIQVMTIGVSTHPASSFQKVINSQFNWTLIFFVSCYVFAKPGRAKLWAMLFTLTFLPIFLIVIKENHDSAVPWAGHIPSFLKVQDPAVARILAGGHREGGEYRVEATFSTPLGLGEYVALAVPFILYFITGPYRFWVRILAAATIPVCFWVVIQSDSRIGYIGCILSLMMFTGMQAFHMWKTDRKALLAPAVVVGYPAGAIVIYLATLFVGRIRQHVWGTGQYYDSNEARKQMYIDGIPKMLKRPWGVGQGNGGEYLGHYDPAGVLTIDTYYMVIGLEFGIIGFFVYYGMFIITAIMAGREGVNLPKRDDEFSLLIPIVASVVNYILIKSVFAQDESHALVYMMMGMAVALIARRKGLGITDPPKPKKRLPGGGKPRLSVAPGGLLQPGE